MFQNKYTVLHFFIERYIDCFLAHEGYYLSDSLCDDYELNLFIMYFEQLNSYINGSSKVNFSFIDQLEEMNLRYEESDCSISEEYKEIVEELFENYIEEFNKVADEVIESTFFLLYQNKKFLFKFNKFLSTYITEKILPNEFYNNQGNIIRKNYLPKWLKNAIFYRDRGKCQSCGKDLTNLLNILDNKELHYDHVIPLDSGGSNDSTNYQLLCKVCNEKKSGDVILPQYQYQMFW